MTRNKEETLNFSFSATSHNILLLLLQIVFPFSKRSVWRNLGALMVNPVSDRLQCLSSAIDVSAIWSSIGTKSLF